MKSRNRVTTVSILVGASLTIVGFLIWYFTDMNTKIFQLSNDLIGAGIFVVAVSLVLKVFNGKK